MPITFDASVILISPSFLYCWRKHRMCDILVVPIMKLSTINQICAIVSGYAQLSCDALFIQWRHVQSNGGSMKYKCLSICLLFRIYTFTHSHIYRHAYTVAHPTIHLLQHQSPQTFGMPTHASTWHKHHHVSKGRQFWNNKVFKGYHSNG